MKKSNPGNFTAEHSNPVNSDYGLTDALTAPFPLPKPLCHRFRIIAFDWDGTAVPNRNVDATEINRTLDKLLRQNVTIAVITGTNFHNIHRQLTGQMEDLRGTPLYLLTNRGSEVYTTISSPAPELIYRREATPLENRQLDAVAERLVDALTRLTHGKISFHIIYDRLNRRKIDLIPEPEWGDPPKSKIGELLLATEARLQGAGLSGGVGKAFALAQDLARREGLMDARITSDVKHIEVGLTDKGDSARWIMQHLAIPRGLPSGAVTFGGDEFGPIGGFPGSDSMMITPESGQCFFFSVGPEPNGVPNPVIHLGGGPQRFHEFLEAQLRLHRQTILQRP